MNQIIKLKKGINEKKNKFLSLMFFLNLISDKKNKIIENDR